MNEPYFDQDVNTLESGPTLQQTLSDAEPNMTLQGFTQFENSIVAADNAVYGKFETLNDAGAVAQATEGLSAADAASANNAYANALNYTGGVLGYNPPPLLSAEPYSDSTTSSIGFFDPKLASIVVAAKPNMTSEGFAQFEVDVDSLYEAGNPFKPDNTAIVTAAEQNLSAGNRAAAENALAASSQI